MKFSERIKQRIINFLFRNLLNTVVLEDVISTDKAGNIFIGGKPLPSDELKQLIAECKALEGFSVWRIINETIKNDALHRGWTKSIKMEDLNSGKTIFYTLDLQQSVIRTIKSKEVK